MNTVGVTNYTNQTTSKHFDQKNFLALDPEQKNICEMCIK